jgi:hypothetical protein
VRASTKINLDTPPLTTEGATPPPATNVPEGQDEKGRKKESTKKKGDL